MSRSPINAIVIPFRQKEDGTFEFAVFHRTDNSMWHFVSGGAEDDETAFDAAQREAKEEADIPSDSNWIKLDSRASIPRTAYPATSHWPDDLFIVPEFSFAVNADDHEIILSDEHDEVRWLSFEGAADLLTWDSNRVALWELNERLRSS
jgi:dATP pyrophosphohydrolase